MSDWEWFFGGVGVTTLVVRAQRPHDPRRARAFSLASATLKRSPCIRCAVLHDPRRARLSASPLWWRHALDVARSLQASVHRSAKAFALRRPAQASVSPELQHPAVQRTDSRRPARFFPDSAAIAASLRTLNAFLPRRRRPDSTIESVGVLLAISRLTERNDCQ